MFIYNECVDCFVYLCVCRGGSRIIVSTYRERKYRCWEEKERECLLLRKRSVPRKIKYFFHWRKINSNRERCEVVIYKCKKMFDKVFNHVWQSVIYKCNKIIKAFNQFCFHYTITYIRNSKLFIYLYCMEPKDWSEIFTRGFGYFLLYKLLFFAEHRLSLTNKRIQNYNFHKKINHKIKDVIEYWPETLEGYLHYMINP